MDVFLQVLQNFENHLQERILSMSKPRAYVKLENIFM